MSEMRFDPVGRTWVIIAPERGARPTDFLPFPPLVNDEPCPFCLIHGGEEPSTIVDRRTVEGDTILAVANRFPALRIEQKPRRRAVGPYDHVSGVGAHEVIVETARHDVAFADLPAAHLAAVVMVWRDRIADLMRDRRVHTVTVFKNSGPRAAATLKHAHSQVIATPVRPPRLADELAAMREHYFTKERCLACDVIDFETEAGERVVEVTERFVAFCPFASRHPFEVQIYPRLHGHDFTRVSDEDTRELARLVKRTLKRIRRALSDPDYNLGLHTAPSLNTLARAHHDIDGMELFWHWRLEIIPRVQSYGGFEIAADVHINPVAPEDAAAHLRDLDPEG